MKVQSVLLWCVLLAASLLIVAASEDAKDEDKAEEARLDAECAWTRQDVFECVKRHARDIDEDGRLDAREIALFKKKLLGWWNGISDVALSIGTFFGGKDNWLTKYTLQEIMHRCGDADGYVTLQSWNDNRHTCERHCRDWTRFMDLCTALDRKPHAYEHLKE